MPTRASPPLGDMFTPDEKRVLRGRDQRRTRDKDRLIVRLADAFTFRRAPRRRWQPPFNCFEKAALPEVTDLFHHELPALSHSDFTKANEVMDRARSRISQDTAPAYSGLTADELVEILQTSQDVWTKDGRDRCLTAIINSIPNYAEINKFVCIGLSEIAVRLDPRTEKVTVLSRCLAQHLAVMTMVRYLRGLVSHKIDLFAADWSYDTPHQQALDSLGFKVLNACYGSQEHFTAIDDNTMLISFSIADFESILPIVSEYARPVAIIYDAYDYLINKSHSRPPPSPIWSRVRYNDSWVTIPGPPLVRRRATMIPGIGGLATQMPPCLPFYTESTGQMLDEYDVTMDLYKFDVKGLANRFELHPDIDHRPSSGDKEKQKHFVSKNSRLFVRKTEENMNKNSRPG
ncbi:hypothetical protein F4808DRAFT_462493 [Astrocystis sublimbata]|nr:hypothetical protein F4808DRAFT_462493 [Astrocystis sublimbata]